MNAPRLEIDLDKIFHNASTLVTRLEAHGIAVTAITKACCGAPNVAQALLRAGATSLGDSRIENLERMRQSGIRAPMTLIRSPMMSQVDRVVASADISLNTEMEIVSALSRAAGRAGKVHGVVLMVELGDLREGILLRDIEAAVETVRRFPNIEFAGLGTNLACRSGVSPDNRNMAELSALAGRIERRTGSPLSVVSGGNSSNLEWVFNGGEIARVNNLRLGESILLGREPLHRQPIDGLHTDAINFIAEVIESKIKPSRSWGTMAQAAFDDSPVAGGRGEICQSILAVGRQDIDPRGLQAPSGIDILGASSDHLVLDTGGHLLAIGSEVSFEPDYSALLRAMTSSYVTKTFVGTAAISYPRVPGTARSVDNGPVEKVIAA